MAQVSIIDEIKKIIESLDYGSVEVIVQDKQVTQISTRIIKKTNSNVKPANKIVGKVDKARRTGINVNFKY